MIVMTKARFERVLAETAAEGGAEALGVALRTIDMQHARKRGPRPIHWAGRKVLTDLIASCRRQAGEARG